jgi:hypothetical protein
VGLRVQNARQVVIGDEHRIEPAPSQELRGGVVSVRRSRVAPELSDLASGRVGSLWLRWEFDSGRGRRRRLLATVPDGVRLLVEPCELGGYGEDLTEI